MPYRALEIFFYFFSWPLQESLTTQVKEHKKKIQ